MFCKCAHPESRLSSRHSRFRPTLLYPNTDEEAGRGGTFSALQAAGQPAKVSQIISAFVASLFWVLHVSHPHGGRAMGRRGINCLPLP